MKIPGRVIVTIRTMDMKDFEKILRKGQMKVKILRANIDNAKEIHAMQVEAFKELLEKYQDFTFYYFICIEKQKVGAIRIVDKRKADRI